jgi:hypothetical protein
MLAERSLPGKALPRAASDQVRAVAADMLVEGRHNRHPASFCLDGPWGKR